MKLCHSCGKEVEVRKLIGRKETCPHCRADLRCCLNCTFYDAASYNACRESQAERTLDKERSNFCDYFTFKESSGEKGVGGGKDKAIDKLDALFESK